MADAFKQVLSRPIQLADSLSKEVQKDQNSRAESQELKHKADRLAVLLRQAARADLYDRPTLRIAQESESALDKALALAIRYRNQNNIIRRLFTPIPTSAFNAARAQLDRCIGDLGWLIRISTEDDIDYVGLPPIASNEPILGMIWVQVVKLMRGSQDKKADAASFLASYARDNDHYGRLIIEEQGVAPLLKLLKEGNPDGQENAAAALLLLAKDKQSIEAIVQLPVGACSIFAKVLKEGGTKVQTLVTEAIAEFADKHPPSQDLFAQNHVLRLLVVHLSYETIEEPSKYFIPPRATSIHSVVMANKETHKDAGFSNVAREDNVVKHPMGNHTKDGRSRMHNVVQTTMDARHDSSGSITVNKGKAKEDPTMIAKRKSMAAKALWKLAKGNLAICKSITESRALLCFAVLLEKGPEDVQYYSAMAVKEIALVAEKEPELRRFAFKPSASTAKAVINQLITIVERGENSKLLIPSIISLGCLAKTFRATETRIIGPLVKLLDERETDVMREAAEALIKFTKKENYLHKEHSEAVIKEGAIMPLVQLVLFGEHSLQMPALTLLCLVALNVPENEELAKREVLNVLDGASKRGFMVLDETMDDDMLLLAREKLELYQSRDTHNVNPELLGPALVSMV